MTQTLRQSPTGPLVTIDASDVENESSAPGATVEDALDTLSGQLPANSNDVDNESTVPGATLTNALDALADPVTTARIADDAGTLAKLNGGVLSSLTSGTPTATGTATNLSCGSITIAANTTVIGDTYRSYAHHEFDHTAAATPTIVFEGLRNGVTFISRTINPVLTAGNFGGVFHSSLRFLSLGATGSAVATLLVSNSYGLTITDFSGAHTVTFTVDTTVNQTILFRMRMGTSVASNTITVYQANIEKIINS